MALLALLTNPRLSLSTPAPSAVDEMSTRVDALDKAIGELIAHAGIEEEGDKKAVVSASSASSPAS